MAIRNIPPLTSKQIELFWSRVQIGKEDECWPWTKARSTSKGKPTYGAFCPNGTQTFPSHRIAYFLSTQDDPVGMVVRHLICDNPPCCNPKHLAKGTIADNNHDAKNKGRTALGNKNAARLYPEKLKRGTSHWTHQQPDKLARGSRNGAYTHPEQRKRGASHGMARLTEAQVIEIRDAHAKGSKTIALAKHYGVAKGTITFIVNRQTWKHL